MEITEEERIRRMMDFQSLYYRHWANDEFWSSLGHHRDTSPATCHLHTAPDAEATDV